VVFKDGMFIINESNSGYFWYSGLYDATSWENENGNPYKTEGSSDKLLAIGTTNNEIWLLGSASSEVWYSTGDSNSPLEKIHGGFSNIGISAPNSLASNGVNLFWLGASDQGHGIVWMSNGYQPQRISHYGIEQQIAEMITIGDAVGYCYQQAGHPFYVLSFPEWGKTFCYDISTSLWHERAYRKPATGVMESHLASCHAFFNDENIVGDRTTGNLYKMSLDTFTDNGGMIKRIRTTPHISNENKRISINRIEIEMERGNGASGQEAPSMCLSSSGDGGYTWSAERLGNIGQIGAYGSRVFWSRCGQARDRIFRLSTTAPVRICLVDAYVEAESE